MSKPKHHIRKNVCSTRAPYRDGRKPTAVKVYTIHHESKYLLIQGVPTVGASNQLLKIFETVGEVAEHKILDDYPGDQFTEVHRIKYKKIQSARFAKRRFDDWSFYGGVLHVCYSPEFESVQETREKLRERRRVVEAKSRQYKTDGTHSQKSLQTSQSHLDTDKSTGQGQQNVSVQTADEHLIQCTNTNYNSASSRSDFSTEPNFHGQNSEILRTEIHGGLSRSNSHPCGQTGLAHSEPGSHHQYLPTLSFEPPTRIDNIDRTREQYGRKGLNQASNYAEQVSPNQASIYTEKAPRNQTSSYAEEVLAQARSLQNYGNVTKLTKQINTKRSHTGTDQSIIPIDKQEISTQNVIADNEEELSLPPPPKQTKFSHNSSKTVQKYGGARVPSAQATFPRDFDARTDRHNVLPDHKMDKESGVSETLLNKSNVNSESEQSQKMPHTKTMQEKVEDNLKNKPLVIKDFSKKGGAPKFIPRQAQIKMKISKTEDGNKAHELQNKTDKLSEQIRKNAFKLGKPQGPADLGPSTSNESLDPKEKSVMDSMLKIRKKLTKVSH